MPDEKLDFKKVLPVFVIVLIDLLGLTIIIPMLPLYSVSFGADPLIYGLLGASYPVMQFIGAPVLGRLSDRYGRKPILIISQIGTLIGFIILGFANALWMLFVARLIDGISGANISTAQAVITDSTTEKTRTQGLGLIGAAFGLGFIIGPIIAFVALAVSDNNYAVPAFVAAAFSLASILLTAFWLPETLPVDQCGKVRTAREAFSPRGLFHALARPGIGILLALMFAQQLAFGGMEQLMALFTVNRLGMNASDNAALFVFVGLIAISIQGYFIGRWSRRFGDRRLIYAGLGFLTLGLLLIALTPHRPVPWYDRERMEEQLAANPDFRTHEIPTTRSVSIELPGEERKAWSGLGWLLAALVPTAVGGSILHPAINSLITKRVHPDEVGGMLGLSASMFSGGNAFGPVIGGALFSALGSTAPFVAGAALIAALFAASWRAIQPGREEHAPAGLAHGHAPAD